MKQLLILPALLVSVGIAAAQTVPFKKANAVLVTTKDAAPVALKRLALVLQEQGYVMDKVDYELGSLITKPKNIPKGFKPSMIIQAVQKDSVITLRGSYRIDAGTMATDSNAEFSGMEGAANKLTFRELEKAAKAYPGGRITYAKKD